MQVTDVLNILVPIVFIGVGIALIFFIVELIKMVKTANSAVADVKEKAEPMLDDAATMTHDIVPAVAKIDPMMDRLQLTVDSLNLEMMRLDQILENVAEITDSASSATAAVDSITNAPLKAVNSVASKVKSALGVRGASTESEQLAEQRVAVAQALEDYKAAERKAEKASASADQDPEPAAPVQPAQADDGEQPHLEIDPDAIKESPFFNDEPAEA